MLVYLEPAAVAAVQLEFARVGTFDDDLVDRHPRRADVMDVNGLGLRFGPGGRLGEPDRRRSEAQHGILGGLGGCRQSDRREQKGEEDKKASVRDAGSSVPSSANFEVGWESSSNPPSNSYNGLRDRLPEGRAG